MCCVREKGGLGIGSLVLYIAIIAIVAMISLAIILNITLSMPPPKSEIKLKYYISGQEIDHIECTIEDPSGYAYYDSSKNSVILDVLVLKDNKPQVGVWITLSGCGITSESAKTDEHGFAHLNIRDVHLPPGIDRDHLTITVLGKTFELPVIRA